MVKLRKFSTAKWYLRRSKAKTKLHFVQYLEQKANSEDIGTGTDGALWAVGFCKNALPCVRWESPDIITTHCFPERWWVSKSLGDQMKSSWMVVQTVTGDFLAVQWLGSAFQLGDTSSILGQGTKIPQVVEQPSWHTATTEPACHY